LPFKRQTISWGAAELKRKQFTILQRGYMQSSTIVARRIFSILIAVILLSISLDAQIKIK
jgi:hypothetical protein